MTDLILVMTTMPDDDRAEQLAATLVGEGLAACVNVHGAMTSLYRWTGAVERDAERQLVIKTTRARLSQLEARLLGLHPYELPEFVVVGVEATESYGAWLRESTTPSFRVSDGNGGQ